MNKFNFAIWITAAILGFSAGASDVCTICPQAEDLMRRMDKVVPDPLNAETIDLQDDLSGEALKMVHAGLTEKNFTPGNAKTLVKLIAKTIPYDNSMDFVRENMRAFQHQYNKPKSLLKATIEQMQKAGEISIEQKNQMIEFFGVAGSTTSASKSKK